jgi:Family of unknown function (DUF5317)
MSPIRNDSRYPVSVSFLGLVVLVAALVPLLTRGSYRRLAEAPWHWVGLLALGLALQLLLDTSLIHRSSYHSVGFGILVASYVLLVGFCAGNLLVRGMAVVLIGVALNGFIVTIDQGMPVRIPPDWGQTHVTATVKHHPRVPGDHLLALTDVIVLRRLDSIVSFGDLILAFGLVDLSYWASRRARRSPRGVPNHHDDERPTPEAYDRDDSRETDQPVPAGRTAGRRTRTKPAREREHVGVGRGRGRSAPPHATVAIQDALERLERP